MTTITTDRADRILRRFARCSVRGASLVDALVAVVLLSLLMAAAYSSLASQMRTHAGQAMLTETMTDTRNALRVMAEQIEQAGYGVPNATSPSVPPQLILAQPTQFSFWSNVKATHTYLTANATKNATVVTVLSATGVKAGTSVYITDTTNWYFGTVQQASGNTVTLSPKLTYNFVAGSQVNPVEQVTFALVGTQLQRNGKRFIGNVTGLQFTYDSATLNAIRQITVQLSAQTRAVDALTGRKLSVSLTTRVAPPNLAL